MWLLGDGQQPLGSLAVVVRHRVVYLGVFVDHMSCKVRFGIRQWYHRATERQSQDLRCVSHEMASKHDLVPV